MTAAIAVEGLEKSIAVGFWGTKRTILAGVSLTVESGSTTGFVGPNGAGKSSTIKHIIGGARPTAGSVRVFGEDPRVASARKKLGYMPELPYLPPTLTPREMVRLHASLYGVAAPAGLLARVGLAERAGDRVGSFSKGMQTRLSLALALLHGPALLVLDEPMSGLDPVGRQLVRSILREEAQQGRTIFFSSHVLSDVEALCDRVVVINSGRVVWQGTTAQSMGEAPRAFTVRVMSSKQPVGVKEARREGDTWVVVVDGTDAVAVASALQAGGATVLELSPLRASLEERIVDLLPKSAS